MKRCSGRNAGELVRSLNVQITLKISIEESDRQIAGYRRRIEFLEGQRVLRRKVAGSIQRLL